METRPGGFSVRDGVGAGFAGGLIFTLRLDPMLNPVWRGRFSMMISREEDEVTLGDWVGGGGGVRLGGVIMKDRCDEMRFSPWFATSMIESDALFETGLGSGVGFEVSRMFD